MSYDPRACGAKCDVCPLKGSTVVPPENNISDLKMLAGDSIAIVGDAPGEPEEKRGTQFVGPAGAELDTALRQAGIRRSDVHVTTVLLCRPPSNKLSEYLANISRKNREIEKEYKLARKEAIARCLPEPPKPALVPSPIECCAPRLEAELRLFSRFITLGKTAAQAVTGTGASIMAIRGGMMELEATERTCARIVMPTVNPSFVLRMPRWKHVFRSDIHKAGRWFRGEAGWVPPKIIWQPTAAQLREFFQTNRIFTFDIETDGIESLTARIRCLAIGDGEEVVSISLLGKDGHTKFYDPQEEAAVKAELKRFFEDETKVKAGHNAGYYDKIVLQQQLKIDPKPVIDTILLHRCVESELPHGLAYVGSMYTEAPAWKTSREGQKLSTQSESDHELAAYCVTDVAVTARVIEPLVDQVNLRQQREVWASDQRIQAVCADMHTVGMFVDQEMRLRTEKELLARRYELLSQIRDRLGDDTFNPASVYQMRDLLFEKWKLSPELEDEDRLTGSGDPSTADLVLRTLLTDRSVTQDHREIIKLVRYYRKVQKVLGTYVVKLRSWDMVIDERLGWDDDDDWVDKETRKRYGIAKKGIVDPRTGRMHPGYNAHVAVTGRLSSSKPINAQNFPKALRAMVRAAPGHVLVGADMDQLELRIAAARWGVELYLKAFASGKDPHSMTAFAVFGDAFCKAAGITADQFERPGVLVGESYINGKFEGSGEAKKMRDLSKAVQYASIAKGQKVALLGENRSKAIEKVKPGDWTWAWSTQRLRYEPTQVKNVWLHGTKPCVRVTFAWGSGNQYQDSVIVTDDHPMVLRNGKLRHAGSLRAGDRLMPFRRREVPMQRPQGYTHLHLHPFNDERVVSEHRVVKGFYEPGERLTHVHHLDENPLNNHPDNLEVLDHLTHYNEHKEHIDEARRSSEKWRVSVSDPEVRSVASKKAWEGRRERQDTDRTFGPRGSILDAFADQIGKKTDEEIAQLAGCTATLIGQYRKAHELAPPVGQRGWLRWLLTNDVLWHRLLHDKTDIEMVALVLEHFGVEVTRHAVGKTRKQLGVPAVKKSRKEVYPRRTSKLDPWAERIGHESDAVIATEAGCTVQAVQYFRRTRGIPAYWQEAPFGTNHVVLSVEPVGEFEVWDLEVDHEDHNFAMEAGIFVHNSQYMAKVETVHKLICKTEIQSKNGDGTTDLPYALLPLKRVRQMRDNWLEGASEFTAGWDREIAHYRQHGYVKEDVSGRRRDFLDGEMPNEIVNFPIQSTAAALMNKAILELHEQIPLHKWGPGTGIINQCHDSIVVECPEDKAQEVAAMLEEAMNQTHPALPGVEITATAAIGATWKETG